LLIALIVIAVVLVLLAALFVLWRRRRPVETDIQRDAAVTRPPDTTVPRGLRSGLEPTRRALGERLGGLFRSGLTDSLWSDLEDALVGADVGVSAATAVVDRVRAAAPEDAAAARTALRDELVGVFGGRNRDLVLEGDPAVVVVVGVNGSGKTTTIAKLAAQLEGEGHRVLLGAADTFRAAAAEQLSAWAGRLGIDIVTGQPGADPASVAFDALAAARARARDVVIVDTAGRLHSKQNLMDELGKVVRVLRREAGTVGEVLLVLDGTTGQNGMAQARAFTEAVGVTGAAITKLDGTARGGIAVAVEQEMGIPVKLVGVGEAVDDLLHFEAVPFVDALLGD
jgi:fused signal recognition particle receptor